MSGSKDDHAMDDDWEYYDDSTVLPDFWQAFVNDEKPFTNPLDYWLQSFSKPFENQYGWNMYREFWRVWVPLLLAPRHGTSSVDQLTEMEERKVQEVLIDSLEQFICGKQDVAQVFKSLSETDVPDAVCGHVFKPGETCYNCRDCGQDATCVLCVECFKNSEHRQHRYRISTSEGGGYCDCGDPEAFTSFSSCSLHLKGEDADEQSAVQVLETFPDDLRDRAKDLLYNVCKYCLEVVSDPKGQSDLVSGAKEKELFPDLKFPLQFSNYCCILMNDENHSYNDVIRVLTKVLPKPSPKLAMDLTTYVDKHGKAVVRVGNYQECMSVSQKIEGLTRMNAATVLKSGVWHSYIVAHQSFVTRLLEWLPTLFKVSSGFRALFSEVMFMNSQLTNLTIKRAHGMGLAPGIPLCEAVLLNDANSWKKVRSLWLNLLVDGVMKDYDSKRELAVLFAKNYPTIVTDFIMDDQEREASIMSLSVQIFTVPSIAIYLVEKCGALANLLKGFLNLLQENMNEEGNLDLSSWLTEEKSEFTRGLASLHDLTYLLGVAPGPHQWSDDLRKQFRAGADLVLQVLSMMQGMDSMQRQVGQHQEMEDNVWKRTHELTSAFSETVRLVRMWAISDRPVLTHMINECLVLLVNKQNMQVREVTKHLSFLGPPKTYSLMEYDVSKQPVSVHVPVHRLLTNLLVETPKYDLDHSLRLRIEDQLTLSQLIEPVLQTVVVVAQINIGMWRRNGTMAESQAFLYNSRKYCPGQREADLLLLQLCLALTEDVETMLVTILARFKLAKWATGDLDHETAVRNDEFIEHCNGLAEQWLNLILAVAGERSIPGIGQEVNQRQVLRRELLHYLCIDPLPRSAIARKLPDLMHNLERDTDEVLAEVADLKPSPKDAGKRIYFLKAGLEKEYNAYYSGYTKEQQTAALESQLAATKSCCPPPSLPPLTKMGGGLVRVLQSSVVLQACVVTLRRCTDTTSSGSRYWTEGQVHRVLYLLGLGAREQAVEGERSGWKSAAEASSVLELVQKVAECQKLPEHVRQLAYWVLGQARGAEEPMDIEESKGEGDAEKEKKKKAEAAAARRAKILAQMNRAQKNFAVENKGVLESLAKEESASKDDEREKVVQAKHTVCLGPGQTDSGVVLQHHTCILCQEEVKVGSGPVLVMAAYIQKSTVLSNLPAWDGATAATAQSVSPHHLSVGREVGPHVSSCGHAMHATCYQKFFDSLVVKERDRAINLLSHKMNFDVSNGEFLCPLCERLSNTVLPLTPSVSELRKRSSVQTVELSLSALVSGLQASLKSTYLKEDKENGPALPRIALKTSLEEQAALHGAQFAQGFQPSKETDFFPFDDSITAMMNVFSVACFTTSLELPPFEEDYRVPLVCLQAAALTLHNLEQGLTRDEKPLFGGLNPRDEDTVRFITRFIATFPSSYSKPLGSSNMRDMLKKMKNFYKLKSLQSNAVFLLSSILGGGPEESQADPLQLDSLGVLVSLVVSLPCLFESEMPPRLPSGQGLELHCLKICLLLHTVQVLSSLPPSDYPMGGAGVDSTSAPLLTWSLARHQAPLKLKTVDLMGLYSKLEKMVLPFLRCAALLFQHFSDVTPGSELVKEGGRSYSLLARYLGLPPSLHQLISSPASSSLLATLIRQNAPSTSLPRFPLTFRRVIPPTSTDRPFYPLAGLARSSGWSGGLIPLPRDYTDLMNLASNFVCPNSVAGVSPNPALCLVCGLLLCSQSHCCEAILGGVKCGGCTVHSRTCGADTGVFLQIRACWVVLQSKMHRGTILPAPYLDEYGEADMRLKRGNPLFLDDQKYEELNRIWMRNEVPEKIAHSFDPDILILIDFNSL